MENPIIEDLERASAQLRRSENGSVGTRDLLAFLDAGRDQAWTLSPSKPA